MSDTESDEDLKKAIAMSLGKEPPSTGSGKPIVIDIVTSDEDDDLDAPVTARKITSKKPPAQKRDEQACEVSTVHTEKPRGSSRDQVPSDVNFHPGINSSARAEIISVSRPPNTVPFLELNRKQMEEERLQRASQRKRKDEQSSSASQDAKKRKASTSPPRPQEQAHRQVKTKLSVSADPPPATTGALPILSFKEEERALRASGVQFPNGVVKKTWAYGCPRQDDIKIEEVLQKNDLELAVLSSFQIDPDWVASKLDPATKVVFVLQAKTESEKENIRSEAPGNYRFCFPSMEGNINCMHSKLQLLSHPTHLRVVVPSANLVSYDWGESGSMENVCFLIDLPRIPEGKSTDGELTEFGKELLHFVQAMGLDETLIDSLRRFDFSRTSHLAFVHSIGGSHSGKDWKRTGYCGLGTAVRNLGLHTEETLDIDIVAASIGNLNDSFIKSIYLAAQGDDGLKEYEWRTSRPAKSKAETSVERKLSENLKSCFRIYFPSRETVAKSKGGLGGAGTICFQSKWYNLDTFPKHLMRDCQSHRRDMLMHNKMIFVRPRDVRRHGSRAWAYVGSANLSESAWGRLVKDKSTKKPKLNCRNWECGVIVSASAAASEAAATTTQGGITQQALVGMEVFGKHVPVPMVVPGEEYGTRRPWFYNEP